MPKPRTPKKRGPKPDVEWIPAFLDVLRRFPNVSFACHQANVPRRTAYDRRSADPAFASLWDDALTEGGEVLEAAAIRRAGESSDTLMIFLLKGIFPEKYRERRDYKHGGGDTPVEVTFKLGND